MEKLSSRIMPSFGESSTEGFQSGVQRTGSSSAGGFSGRTEWRNELSTPTGNQLRIADPVRFEGVIEFAELPEQPILRVEKAELTPDVLNVTRLAFSNTVTTIITNFLSPQEGQHIILLGDGNTEVANNSNIVNHSASNTKLDNGVAYSYVYMLGKWRQVK